MAINTGDPYALTVCRDDEGPDVPRCEECGGPLWPAGACWCYVWLDEARAATERGRGNDAER